MESNSLVLTGTRTVVSEELRDADLKEMAKNLQEFGISCLRNHGHVGPMMIADRITDAGQEERLMFLPEGFSNEAGKMIFFEALKQLFQQEQVYRYAFLSEAWTVTRSTQEDYEEFKKSGKRVADLDDRVEVLTSVAADDTGNTSTLIHKMLRDKEGNFTEVEKFRLFDKEGKDFMAGTIPTLLLNKNKTH